MRVDSIMYPQGIMILGLVGGLMRMDILQRDKVYLVIICFNLKNVKKQLDSIYKKE